MLRTALERSAALDGDGPVGQARIGPMAIAVLRFGVIPPTATTDGDIGVMAMYAGESVALVDTIEPAAQVVNHTAHQAEDLLRRAAPT